MIERNSHPVYRRFLHDVLKHYLRRKADTLEGNNSFAIPSVLTQSEEGPDYDAVSFSDDSQGVPRQPYSTKIASALWAWAYAQGTDEYSRIFHPARLPGIEEDFSGRQSLLARGDERVTELVVAVTKSISPGLAHEYSSTHKPEIARDVACQLTNRLDDLFNNILGLSGVLILLGCRQTVGTVWSFPPSREKCCAAFNKPLHGGTASKLTVGARAFAKHAHRSSEEFWGVVQGSEENMNQAAVAKLNELFDSTVWMNTYILSESTTVYEIRTAGGYGARWSQDGSVFRGFVEPYMELGHEKRWRH